MFSDVTCVPAGTAVHKSSQTRPTEFLLASHVKKRKKKTPWEQVIVHLLGPLPRFINGNTWLLVMQDCFTKWVELSPHRRATPAVKQKLTDHLSPRMPASSNFGQWQTVRSADATADAFKIRQRTAQVHAPYCNPVERTNKTIKTMIAQYVDRNHRHIRALHYAYNTARHEATGYTPAYLNYGREHSPLPETRRRRTGTTPPEVNRHHAH